jgi:hypothetical protein
MTTFCSKTYHIVILRYLPFGIGYALIKRSSINHSIYDYLSQKKESHPQGNQMKFKLLNTTITGLILSVSCLVNSANAGLIQSDYLTLGDNLAVYDEDLNLTWLDLSLTDGLSYAVALASHSDFQYASDLQVTTLFNNFFGATTTYNADGSGTSDWTTTGNFVTLFGPTYASFFGLSSYGWFYDDLGAFRRAGATASFNAEVIGPNSTINSTSFINTGDQLTGTYLVRAGRIDLTPPVVTDVPEPSTLAILGLTLLGLASRRFKKSF